MVYSVMDVLLVCWSGFIIGFGILNASFGWTVRILPNVLHEVVTYGKLRRKVLSKWHCFSVKKNALLQCQLPVVLEQIYIHVPRPFLHSGRVWMHKIRWFTLFYGWGLVWNSLMLYYGICTIIGRQDIGTGLANPVLQVLYYPRIPPTPQATYCFTATHSHVLLSLLLVCVQTGRRLMECLCVTVFSNSSKIHWLHLAFGFYFYTALGPGILQSLNESSDPSCRFSTYYTVTDGPVKVTLSQVVAVVLFVWSTWHQYRCHKILAELRQTQNVNDKTLYSIPHGDWFAYTSSPHYLAEILIYVSLCVLLGLSNLYSFLVLSCTVLNLLYTSRLNHEWYIRTFRHYPRRRVLVPFIY